jgi:hypothetical protein
MVEPGVDHLGKDLCLSFGSRAIPNGSDWQVASVTTSLQRSLRTFGSKPVVILTVTVLMACLAVVSVTSAASATPRASAGAAHVGPVKLVPDTTQLSGVSCNSKNLCLAVGSDGADAVVVPIADGKPGTPEVFPSTTIDAISCANSTTCVAVGDQPIQVWPGCSYLTVGVVYTFTNGNLTNGQTLQENCPLGFEETISLYGVGCQTGSNCVAVGYDNNSAGIAVPIKNGDPRREVPIGPGYIYGAACRSTGVCIVDGEDPGTREPGGFAEVFKGGTYWGSGHGALFGVACHSTGICMAVGANESSEGVVLPLAPAPRPTVTVAGSTSLNGVACGASGFYCSAVGADHVGVGVLVPITDERVGKPEKISGTSALSGVGCASVYFCVAVGSASSSDEGAMFTFSLPG